MTLTLPGGLLTNDQVILAVLTPQAQPVTSIPATYVKIGDYTNGSNTSRITMYRHTVAAGESAQVAIGWSGNNPKPKQALAVIYRGVDPDAPLDGTPLDKYSSLATSIQAKAITTVNDKDQLLVVQSASTDPAAQAWSINGMTERISDPQALLSGAIADQPLPAAGSTGTRTASFPTPSDLATVTLALKPAPPPVLYYQADQLGSTRALTDTKAHVVATYTFDAYGQQTAHTGTADTPLQYAGQYRDTTGLYYLRARYYDPSTAEFLARDTAVSITGEAYGYSGENPLNAIDPSGLSWWNPTSWSGSTWTAIGVGVAVGALAATGVGLIADAGIAVAAGETGLAAAEGAEVAGALDASTEVAGALDDEAFTESAPSSLLEFAAKNFGDIADSAESTSTCLNDLTPYVPIVPAATTRAGLIGVMVVSAAARPWPDDLGHTEGDKDEAPIHQQARSHGWP